MKTLRSLTLLAAALSPAALFICGCSKTDDSTKTAQDAKAAASSAVADVKAAASDTWASIKDFTYERRADFSAAMDRMSKDLDEKTAAMKAKFAGVPDDASKERASALQDYDSARADLKARLTELGNATADTWADAKAKADAAWKRVQAAYDRVTKANAAP
jgi:hypothetical protein